MQEMASAIEGTGFNFKALKDGIELVCVLQVDFDVLSGCGVTAMRVSEATGKMKSSWVRKGLCWKGRWSKEVVAWMCFLFSLRVNFLRSRLPKKVKFRSVSI